MRVYIVEICVRKSVTYILLLWYEAGRWSMWSRVVESGYALASVYLFSLVIKFFTRVFNYLLASISINLELIFSVKYE